MEPNVELKSIGPTEAERLLDKCLPGWQRRIKQGKLKLYSDEMRNGNWRDWSEIKFAQTQNGLFILNGQHRLTAIRDRDTSQKFVVITEYMSEKEARAYYGIIDYIAARTTSDAIQADGRTNDPGFGVTARQCRILAEATRIIDSGFDDRSAPRIVISHAQRIQSASGFVSEYNAIRSILTGGIGDIWKRFEIAPYLACSIYVYRYQPEICSCFLKDVAVGDVQNPYAPARRLRELILSSYDGRIHPGRTRMVRMRWFSRMWNAAYDGQDLQKVYLPSKITFKGTPLA